MIIFSYRIAVIIFVMICAIALIALGGWVSEGAKLDKARGRVDELTYENERLRNALRRRERRSNIEVANEYSEGK